MSEDKEARHSEMVGECKHNKSKSHTRWLGDLAELYNTKKLFHCCEGFESGFPAWGSNKG